LDEQKPPIMSGIRNVDPFLAAWKTWKKVVPMKRIAKIIPATREGWYLGASARLLQQPTNVLTCIV